MSFKEYLLESSIKDIQNAEKVFLLVIGGSASGKNYVYSKNFDFPLVDIDEITKKLAGGDFEKAQNNGKVNANILQKAFRVMRSK